MFFSTRSRKIAFLFTFVFSMEARADELDPIFNQNIPVVLTPTRLRQSLPDVPASVTIISSEMIQNFGIRSIPDALRLVPGMAVTQVTGNDYRVNYHGGNILMPRRMNVLLDGMSVYGSRISRVDWKQLPVPIEDIERIEVIRGPNSASYGSNSLLAVVNIITKHPHEVMGTTLGVTTGSLNTNRKIVRNGGSMGAGNSYRMSLEKESDSGFDYASSRGAGHDSHDFTRINFRSLTDLGAFESVDFQASYSQGTLEAEFVDASQRSFPDVSMKDYSLGVIWKKNPSLGHEVQFKLYTTGSENTQEWRSCVPSMYLLPEVAALGRTNPDYVRAVLAGRVPYGGSAEDDTLAASAISAINALGEGKAALICLDANQNFSQRRYDVELQDTFVLSEELRIVAGIGARYNDVDSKTYFGGHVSNRIWRGFSNVEYKPSNNLTVNVGWFFEKDNLTGSAFSPRVAFNGHVDENNTIRFVVAKANRMPDFVEQRSYWTYHPANYSVPLNGAGEGHFAFTASSPRNLRSEKIYSREIGYFGNFPKYGLMIDAKLFEDKFSDLISEKLQNSDFRPTNGNYARSRGAEFQINSALTDSLSFLVGYSNVNVTASSIFERTQFSRHSGLFGVSYVGKNQWHYTFSVYQYGASSDGQTYFGKEDLTIHKRFKMGSMSVTPLFMITHLDNRSSKFLVDVGRTRESRYDDAMQYYISLAFGF